MADGVAIITLHFPSVAVAAEPTVSADYTVLSRRVTSRELPYQISGTMFEKLMEDR